MKVKYLKSGYVDMNYIIDKSETFCFCTGGRGTGKTYGMISYLADRYIEGKEKFMYIRRRGVEADGISTEATNPFYDLTKVKGSKWYGIDPPYKPYKLGKDLIVFKNCDGVVCGYLTALTTFYKIKSIPFPDVTMIFYDEWIPMDSAPRVKNEYEIFLNAYETINRNREFTGEKPVKLVATSNSETLGNAIYMGLGVIDKALKLQQSGDDFYTNTDRNFSIVLLHGSPISERKQKTALYKLSSGSSFQIKALKNDFLYDDRLVKSINLKGYRAYVNIGELIIYRHKSENKYYIAVGHNNGVDEFYATDEDLKRFQYAYNNLYRAYIKRNVVFETMTAQEIFLMYWDN